VVAAPTPMLAVAGRPPDHVGSAIEMKWDSVRATVLCDAGECRLYSRNRRQMTGYYPEFAAELTRLSSGCELILDAN
jgi:bifunctional non-homologous end joining protein LigD